MADAYAARGVADDAHRSPTFITSPLEASENWRTRS
jgi:hypothetical protein